MVMRGLARAGYNTIHIDDCWSEMQRDGANRLVANKTRFPDGMAALADYVSRAARSASWLSAVIVVAARI